MKAYVLITCFAVFTFLGSFTFHQQQPAANKNAIADSVGLIKKQKADLDKLNARYIETKKYQKFLIWVKYYNKSKLVKVIKDKFRDEDNIEYTYNIVKDAQGKIVMISSFPTSQSGDWDIAYNHYFNSSGKLIAFERFTGFFNSECAGTDEAAHERIVTYYNANIKVIGKTYKLTDSKGKKLTKSKCAFPYDFKDYKIYPDVTKCLAGYHINAALL